MTKLSDLDDNLDPIVKAAMIDDDGRPEPVEDKSPIAEEDAEEGQTQPEESEDEGAEDQPAKEEPADEAAIEEEGDEPKLSRKERRAQRKAYLDAIRRQGEQNSQQHADQLLNDPSYQPLDYNEGSEVDAETLRQDRENYARQSYAKGMELERYRAEQERFWERTEYEDKLLTANPKYSFLDENNPAFDAERASELQQLYFGLVGFDQQSRRVNNPNISWKNFVETEVERMERWAEDYASRSRENIQEQRATASIRPSGSKSTSKLGKLKPGDISKMSAAEYEKYKPEIERQILAQLNQ